MTRSHVKIGLTGSIGMGKSTVLRFFQSNGLETWDADAAVARLYQHGQPGADAIAKLAPQCVGSRGVDKQCLAKVIATDPSLLPKIEDIIHPLVAADRESFSSSVATWAAVYDIPLLFETKAEAQFDKVVVVSAPEHLQRERVLARPNMTEEKFALIVSKQLPDAQKQLRADHVIETGGTLGDTEKSVQALVAAWRKEYA